MGDCERDIGEVRGGKTSYNSGYTKCLPQTQRRHFA